jgi:hypothetical protein
MMRRVIITEDVDARPAGHLLLEDQVLEEALQQDDHGDMAPFFFLGALGILMVLISLYKTEILRLLL